MRLEGAFVASDRGRWLEHLGSIGVMRSSFTSLFIGIINLLSALFSDSRVRTIYHSAQNVTGHLYTTSCLKMPMTGT